MNASLGDLFYVGFMRPPWDLCAPSPPKYHSRWILYGFSVIGRHALEHCPRRRRLLLRLRHEGAPPVAQGDARRRDR